MERKVNINYYGMLAERLKTSRESVSLPANTIELNTFLTDLHPELEEYTFTIAVDQEYKDVLELNSIPQTIDVMPPFAGG